MDSLKVAATHENTVFLRPSGCHARKHGVFEAAKLKAGKARNSLPRAPDPYQNICIDIYNIYIYISIV